MDINISSLWHHSLIKTAALLNVGFRILDVQFLSVYRYISILTSQIIHQISSCCLLLIFLGSKDWPLTTSIHFLSQSTKIHGIPNLYQTVYMRACFGVNKGENFSSPFQTIWDTQTQKRGTIFLSRYLCVTTYILCCMDSDIHKTSQNHPAF